MKARQVQRPFHVGDPAPQNFCRAGALKPPTAPGPGLNHARPEPAMRTQTPALVLMCLGSTSSALAARPAAATAQPAPLTCATATTATTAAQVDPAARDSARPRCSSVRWPA